MNKHKQLLGLAVALVAVLVISGVAYNALLRGNGGATASTSATGGSTTAATDFTMQDWDGNELQLSSFAGKPVVLNFWASWCGPCQMEMPVFDAAYAALGGDIHFVMLDLANDAEPVSAGKAFIEENGYSFPVYFDVGQQAAAGYGVSAIPATYFINAEGAIVYRHVGAMDEATLADALALLQ